MSTQAAEPSVPRRLAGGTNGHASGLHAAGLHAGGLLTGRLSEAARGYQRMLERDPQQPEALIGISLVALASRQNEAAVKMASAAVAVAPEGGVLRVSAWIALGQALRAAGRIGEAERAYAQALRLDGTHPLARMGLGESMLAAGRAEEAAQEFELALRRRPTLAAAQIGLGNALAFQGRHQEALDRYEQALAVHPRLPEAEFAAGFALARLDRPKEAEIRYRRALGVRPDFAAAWINLGSLLREQGQDLHAEAALRRAVELRPDLVSGWVNLAILERERRRPEEVEKYLRKALALNPMQVETLVAWCQFRLAERDVDGAWEWLRRALEADPECHGAGHEVRNMEGILLHTEGRFEEAIAAFDRAEALGHRAAASNRGNSLLDLGRMDEALRAHELAVEREPGGAGARYNLALTQLRLGDWRHGWRNYEARWRFREVHRHPRRFDRPRWRGEPLEGRRILLHAEQGLGDTIQFCRYAAMVAARGGRVILEVQEPVKRLMDSLAAARSGAAETRLLGGEMPDFDLECPLMSLPAVFGTTIETVPWSCAYLGADPALMAEKRRLFPNRRPGLRIGLAWAGNPRYKADPQRSTRLETLLPLLRAVEATWISLQKGHEAERQSEAGEEQGRGGESEGEFSAARPLVCGVCGTTEVVPCYKRLLAGGFSARCLSNLPSDVLVWDGSSGDRDLAETAALVATLDLVITTDTCIAHLAGAMGKPVWILLPHLSDWRWMQKIETTPWYPTARLFRQSAPGDWQGVILRVATELDRTLRPLLGRAIEA